MNLFKKKSKSIYLEIVVIGILILFFLQLISDFLESIYALNLIEVELNENILALLFLLTPIILLFFKKNIPALGQFILGVIIVITRILTPLLAPTLKMITAGIGVGCFLMLLPLLLQRKGFANEEQDGLTMGLSLALALFIAIGFRVLGMSINIAVYRWFQLIGWVLGIIEVLGLYNSILLSSREGSIQNKEATEGGTKQASTFRVLGLSLGSISIMILVFFVFSTPTVISRWTEANYLAILIILTVGISLYILTALYKPELFNYINSWMLLLWNGLFILFLVLTVVVNQIFFAFVTIYPFYAPNTLILSSLFLYSMLALSPVILIDFTLLSRELIKSRPSVRKIGGSFAIASAFFLIMILVNVFTIVWDYIPLVGNLFRDMFWFVFLLLGFVLIPSVASLKPKELRFQPPSIKLYNTRRIAVGLIVLFSMSFIISGFIYELPPTTPQSIPSEIRIFNYNIQQGFDESGNKNFEAQYQVISNANPTIIGLVESDTCRISSGNGDVVRFINERLHLYSYFGPKTVTGTFGIALLSRYPIINPRTFYMESEGEQTATIEAQITIASTTYNIFVTHLGNYVNTSEGDSQIVQQEQVLAQINGKNNVILMGDFNFIPDTEQYNITVDLLDDCWEIASTSIANPSEVPVGWKTKLPEKRIDHIFVSHDLNAKIKNCKYFGGTASDHPAVLIDMTI